MKLDVDFFILLANKNERWKLISKNTANIIHWKTIQAKNNRDTSTSN